MFIGITYIRTVQNAVQQAVSAQDPVEPAKVLSHIITWLGIPPSAENPITMRSVASHLHFLDAPELN
ncbi:MAG: hypothetical protein NT074_01910 [Methanomicrobiales archaeon]|nr:hypothetical protein [Methanomicrobiales archaeon]